MDPSAGDVASLARLRVFVKLRLRVVQSDSELRCFPSVYVCSVERLINVKILTIFVAAIFEIML